MSLHYIHVCIDFRLEIYITDKLAEIH